MKLNTQSLEEFGRMQDIAERVRRSTERYAAELSYFEELGAIRAELEGEYMFYPSHCCEKAGRTVRQVLGERYGLEEVAGYYRPTMERHAWNYDAQRGLYIDLTLDQFFLEFPAVALVPEVEGDTLLRRMRV